jgi:hypothetical protein
MACGRRIITKHVIRDDEDLEGLRLYIRENPSTWEDDVLFRQTEAQGVGGQGRDRINGRHARWY